MTTPVLEQPLSISVIDGVFGDEFVNSFNTALQKSRASHLQDTGGIDSAVVGGATLTLGGSGLVTKSAPKTSLVQPEAETGLSANTEYSIGFEKNPKKKSQPPPTQLHALTQVINEKLEFATAQKTESSKQGVEGRLGPKLVKLDVGSHVGSFVMNNDRLGLTSQCNFGSVKANTCVFKGKWQYEVQLGSKGVMQLGWATVNTKFSQDKGVGDSRDSYAFDGNRIRKWNGTTKAYGEQWQVGDTIGCCIDLDLGNIEYSRNGKHLGVAFANIPRGPGIAYFPAASLAWGESIIVNFGAGPMQFPAAGFNPLQFEKGPEDIRAQLLLRWLDRIVELYPNPETGITSMPPVEDYRTLLICANGVFEALGPNIQSAFVIEQSVLPYFGMKIGLPGKVSVSDILNTSVDYTKCHLLLDIMWTYFEETEMKKCIERMCIIFMNYFRANSLSLSYPFQIYSLHCLTALATHRRTRRYLIHHVLFDQTKLMHFLHVKPVDDDVIKSLLPIGWWAGKSDATAKEVLDYRTACNIIQEQIGVLERLQVEFMKILLTNSDGNERRPSSRSVFLRKFREHIRESVRPGSILQHPLNKAMCTFFRLLQVIASLWREEVEGGEAMTLPDIPHSIFFDMTIDYHECERLGGLVNFLYKTHHVEVSQALDCPDYMITRTAEETPLPSFFRFGSLAGMENILESLSTPTVTVSSASEPSRSGTLSPNSGRDISATSRNIQPSTNDASTGTGPPPMSAGSDGFQVLLPVSPMIDVASPSSTIGVLHPPSAITTYSITENIPQLRLASATSSAEDVGGNFPHLGGSLIAGTASGTNMMIPLDFPMDGTLRLFPGGFLGFAGFQHRVGPRPQNPVVSTLGRDSGTMDIRTSLVELMDDSILVFSCGVKKHIERVVALRRKTEEYVKALETAREELTRPTLTELERVEIQKSVEIFLTKLDEQSRHMAWVEGAVFTPDRQKLVLELIKQILGCLKKASADGILFTFVPEFYVSTLIQLTWLLLIHMHPTVPYTNLAGIDTVLQDVAQFVSSHFSDPRIVVADAKDTLTQALSMFICNRTMLTALENMAEESRIRMVKSILRPYENRAWAQSNWMLVRIWQGDGFAFQYPSSTQARRVLRTKPAQEEFGISINLPPSPSPIFQGHIARVLMENPKLATNYIHSVLNQLNWAFSEFVGLLQEIQAGANRLERAFMESRQLKICCTCFELTQALLRVLEMVIHVAPSVFTNAAQDSSQSLLGRICMLVSQVLNRIGSSSGTFAQVMELGISGVENITYFPILAAVSGILVTLLRNEFDKTDPADLVITKTLLREPSFAVNSLDFLLGRNQALNTNPVLAFSLASHVPDDVSEVELHQIEKVLLHMTSWAPRIEADNESISDDDICTICYAYAKSTTFKPCNHRSCRTCIQHHLMNRGECFFCKGIIEKVIGDDGTVIHDITTLPHSEPASQVDLSRH